MNTSRNSSNSNLPSLIFAGVTALFSTLAQSQSIEPNVYYRLSSQWQGEGLSLDVVNDGKNNQIQLAKTGEFSGQLWKFTPLPGGFYRITTQWQGEGKSLDVVNDGKNNRLQLADTGGYSGQAWKVTPQGNGYAKLTTQWLGDAKSLDVINDGRNNRLQLADSGDYSGQYWKLTQYQPAQPVAQTHAEIPAMSPEQACASMIRGKVAWHQGGDTSWNEDNINRLCQGTNNPQQTVNCFKQGIASHNDWGKAINECAGGAVGGKRVYEVSQIWSQSDANEKCNQVASRNSATWTGLWWTTVKGSTSVCEAN